MNALNETEFNQDNRMFENFDEIEIVLEENCHNSLQRTRLKKISHAFTDHNLTHEPRHFSENFFSDNVKSVDMFTIHLN